VIPILDLIEIRCKTTVKFSVETVLPSRLASKTGRTNSLIFSPTWERIESILVQVTVTAQNTDDQKERFEFRLVENEACTLCLRTDSIGHTFLDCTVATAFYSNIISWFNLENDTDITLSNNQKP